MSYTYFSMTSAFAQETDASAEQIIKALTPSDDITKNFDNGIRGLRPSLPPKGNLSEQMQRNPSVVKVNGKTGVPPDKKSQDASLKEPPTIDLIVNFATGSAELTPRAMQTLNALGAALSSNTLAIYRFRVEGHTDTVGTRDFNRTLSQQRAEAVVEYVGTKFGVASSRMEPVGMGSDKLLVPTPDQVAEPHNRRVQIVNIGS